MTTVEIQTLVAGCMSYLKAATDDNRASTSNKQAQRYAAYLVTAFLCLGLAPRSNPNTRRTFIYLLLCKQ